jgi:hypothetical protein
VIALLVALAAPPELPFPIAPGTWWEYRESYTESLGALDSTSEDTTRFEVRAFPSGPFLHQTGGFDPGSGPVEAAEGWVRLGPWTGEDPLPLPLAVGRAAIAGEGGAAWTVEAEEEISVPAGTFRALRCALRAPRVHSVLWIAPGVGVVRETQGRPGRRPEIERVLLRWGVASPVPDASPVPR